MSKSTNNADLEALLFVHGDSLSYSAITSLLECSQEEAEQVATSLQDSYEQNDRSGLRIIIHEDSLQLVTHPRSSEVIERLRDSTLREALTPAALETLSVVAYRGPLSKSEIESIRGVNCGSIIRTLLLRSLVKRERDPNDKRAFLYRITSQFLQALGVTSAKELPDFEQFTSSQ